MKVSDIMKPVIEQTQELDCINGNIQIASIDNVIGKTDNMYVVDNKNKIIGIVKRNILEYLVDKSKSTIIFQVMKYIGEGIIVTDIDGRVFFVNEEYSKILGVPIYRVLGRYIYELEDRPKLMEVLTNKNPIEINNHLIKSVGRVVSLIIHPLYKDGKVDGAFSVFKDITEINNLNIKVKRISEVAKLYSNQIEFSKNMDIEGIIGEDPKYVNLLTKTFTVAKTDAAVLIRGESGVGKEIFTKIIHNYSDRKEKNFVSVNCAAIPEALFESELFGYEEGSFTGAKKGGNIGKFELADGGTLFLDEIGDMPLLMQAKLLRVLQEGEIEKIGRKKSIPVNVRIIAATNQPLEEMIKYKTFREDLYYRLNVVTLDIPPLKERGNDVILLANYFLKTYNKKYKKELVFSQEVYRIFVQYQWPGNIRELQNYIEYAVILCCDNTIKLSDLPQHLGQLKSDDVYEECSLVSYNFESLNDATSDFERKYILHVLEQSDNNRTVAMEKLKLSRRTFYRKLHHLKIR